MRFKREHKLKVISVLIATTLWYFVVWGKPIQKTIEVPIIYTPYNPNYIVEVSPPNVLLKIKAIRRVLRSFANRELKIKINISKYPPGVYQVRVPIEKLNLPPSVQIKEVSPAYVTVIIKRIVSKKVLVKPVFADLKFFKTTRFKIYLRPRYVIIRAPEDVAKHLKVVYTEPINFSKLKSTKELEVKVVAPLGALSVLPSNVKVIYEEER
ncbi:MAG: hypothetical protein GXO57_04095 [Thermodesulfobacteria bacterium]|nr:hypothetical protein [Thermodesulfobacteriota bacterium]